jgi:hypothetical protein
MNQTRYLLVLVPWLLACGTSGDRGGTPPPSTAAQAASQLPPGHPPIDGPGAPLVPGPRTPATRLAWKVPEGWLPETPSSSMRQAQYFVPGPAGPGECVVFYFGAGQGGDAMANARRWAGQFQQPDGGSSEERMKTSELTVGEIRVLLVEVSGTYAGGMGPAMGGAAAEPKPGQMLLGAVAEGPDANWFFKLTGPEPTVRDQRAAFEGMIRSLRRADRETSA